MPKTKPLTFLERILFFIGKPKRPPVDLKCFKCGKRRHSMIDLGDGDIICEKCWKNWIPAYDS